MRYNSYHIYWRQRLVPHRRVSCSFWMLVDCCLSWSYITDSKHLASNSSIPVKLAGTLFCKVTSKKWKHLRVQAIWSAIACSVVQARDFHTTTQYYSANRRTKLCLVLVDILLQQPCMNESVLKPSSDRLDTGGTSCLTSSTKKYSKEQRCLTSLATLAPLIFSNRKRANSTVREC